MRRAIGGTGLRVHANGLGAMPLSIPGWPRAHVTRAVIARLLGLGRDFITRACPRCAGVAGGARRHAGIGDSFAALRVVSSPDEVAAIDALAVGATHG